MTVLPFTQTADVQAQGGSSVGSLAVSIWALDEPRDTGTGETYDWTGEADVAGAPLLINQGNRQLEIDGTTYKLISAREHHFLPHLQLRLREVRGR